MKSILLLASCLFILSCTTDDPIIPDQPIDPIDTMVVIDPIDSTEMNNPNDSLSELFRGTYLISSLHISEIQSIYDSVGNFLGMGIDTSWIMDDTLVIDLSLHPDTLIIDGLIKSFYTNAPRVTTLGYFPEDTLNIAHEYSVPSTRNNFIRGQIWLTTDSIFLDYKWDNSDIWSAGAFPERGEVKASGVLLE